MWKDFAIGHVEAYLALKDSQERLGFLRANAAEGLPADDERADVVLDLYYYTLQFGIERAFTADKLSVLFSIMKTTFLESMREFLPAKASFNFFRDLLLKHSVQRPPFSVGLFAQQVWIICSEHMHARNKERERSIEREDTATDRDRIKTKTHDDKQRHS